MVNNLFMNSLGNLPLLSNNKSRAINAENPNGERGGGGKASSNLGASRKGSPCITLKSGETAVLGEINSTGIIQHIWITVTDHTDTGYFVLRDLVLRMYWDGEEAPSVESPLGDFFCCGFAKGCTVNSMPIVVNPTRGLNSYFPMPFKKGAKITIENQHDSDIGGFFFQIDYCLCDELPEETGYFHAQWHREKITKLKEDYVIVDNIKGKGQYIGTYMALSTLERYWWGEGEVKFYMDGDKEYPTICGTGTEDYFGGAWSFATQNQGLTVENTYCTAFMGYPYYSRIDDSHHNDYHLNDCPTMRGFYRWHIMDPICFQEKLKVTIQQIGVCHKGLFERQDDVSTVAYWYQLEPHNPYEKLMDTMDRHPR